MISGNFGEIWELFFEVDLVAIDGERLTVTALLDTGFTTGWLAIDALRRKQYRLVCCRVGSANADSTRRGAF